jgi:hypothetical protein
MENPQNITQDFSCSQGAAKLVHLVYLVSLIQPNKQDKPNKPDRPNKREQPVG